MKFISWLISLPVFLAIIVFVLQNRMLVSISFWPFDLSATLPVSILSLGLLAVGFVAGVFITSIRTFRVSREAKKYKREVAHLSEKLKQQPEALSTVPSCLVGGRYVTLGDKPTVKETRASFLKRCLQTVRGKQ